MKKILFASFVFAICGILSIPAHAAITAEECKAAGNATYNSRLQWCKCNQYGYKWDDSQKKCISQQQCISGRENHANPKALACCFEDKAIWDGSDCRCVDMNMDFVLNSELTDSRLADKGGRCNVRSFSCSTKLQGFLGNFRNGNNISDSLKAQIDTFLDNCADTKWSNDKYDDEFHQIVLQLLALGENTLGTPVYADLELFKLVMELDGMASEFTLELDKWKTADGEFNTARLASDLTAAVVLGTTGGVVTSVVMKKKQVESGFEALQCTIGGQIVAGWGDQFSVGIH